MSQSGLRLFRKNRIASKDRPKLHFCFPTKIFKRSWQNRGKYKFANQTSQMDFGDDIIILAPSEIKIMNITNVFELITKKAGKYKSVFFSFVIVAKIFRDVFLSYRLQLQHEIEGQNYKLSNVPIFLVVGRYFLFLNLCLLLKKTDPVFYFRV